MRIGSQSFVPVSWMCKKQTAVSHSVESELISVSVGLRVAGMPALQLLECVCKNRTGIVACPIDSFLSKNIRQNHTCSPTQLHFRNPG